MKKWMTVMAAGLMSAALLAGCGSNETSTQAAKTGNQDTTAAGKAESGFPSQNINGIVQWGEGGGTDSLMRPLATLAEKSLGVSIVVQNKTGGSGSIATQYVYDNESDGYHLLMGAENPPLYEALGILDLTYDDFDCVMLIGDETTGVAVSKNSPYQSLTDIVNDALAGKKITLATTGTGGLPWEVGALIKSVTGAEFTQVQYENDAAAKVAILGGECDFTICKIQSSIEEYTSGDLKMLCMLATEPVALMPDVPLVTAEYPDFEQYLPWGPFYGIFVKKGTDAEIQKTLSQAFKEAFDTEEYQEILSQFYINPLGLSGEEAAAYLTEWKTNTIDALTKAGAVE